MRFILVPTLFLSDPLGGPLPGWSVHPVASLCLPGPRRGGECLEHPWVPQEALVFPLLRSDPNACWVLPAGVGVGPNTQTDQKWQLPAQSQCLHGHGRSRSPSRSRSHPNPRHKQGLPRSLIFSAGYL